ncbi:MAG: monofunctional biosynthetic peptidoglycan transglycosylase [Bacteroidota bacterium]
MARLRRILWRLSKGLAAVAFGYLGLCVLLLLAYRFVYPPVTGVQMQRWVESVGSPEAPERRYAPVDSAEIAVVLRRAVVAAEDGAFYDHRGVDWSAIEDAWAANQEAGRVRRGGSTITQQLIKNLFFTTHRSYLRKAAEIPLAYIAEWILPKERILTLYLNVIEWGPGLFGAEAAAQYHYSRSARDLTRRQAASLGAIIPNPRVRTPSRMTSTTNTILQRMRQMGW